MRPADSRKVRTALSRAGEPPEPMVGRGLPDARAWLITFDVILRVVGQIHGLAPDVLVLHWAYGWSFPAIGETLGITGRDAERLHAIAFRTFSAEAQRRAFEPREISEKE